MILKFSERICSHLQWDLRLLPLEGLRWYNVMNEQSWHQKSKSCLALISSHKTKEEIFNQLVHKATNIFPCNLCANFPMLESISFGTLQQYKTRKGYFKTINIWQVLESAICYVSNRHKSRLVADLQSAPPQWSVTNICLVVPFLWKHKKPSFKSRCSCR